MSNKFGLREKKKAMKKLEILDYVQESMKRTEFESIFVKDICDAVCISNVTFFKYFPQKEDVLDYFELVWTYKKWVKMQTDEPLRGKVLIYNLFYDLAETDNGDKLITNVERYIKQKEEGKEFQVLNDCEKWLLHNEFIYQNVPTIQDLFELAFVEAVNDGDIPKSMNAFAFASLLASIYYGSPSVSGIFNTTLKDTFKVLLDLVFDLVKNRREDNG